LLQVDCQKATFVGVKGTETITLIKIGQAKNEQKMREGHFSSDFSLKIVVLWKKEKGLGNA
jgi:hypothetical protein